MEAQEQIEFRKMFPDSWEKLQRQGASIYHIHEDGRLHVTIGWIRNRLVSTFLNRFHRNKRNNEDSVSWHLFNAYVHQFSNQKQNRSSACQSSELRSRRIHWMPGEKHHDRSESYLNNRQNLHIAIAMQLAGIVRIREHDKSDRIEPTGTPVTAEAVAIIDRCVNCSATRLVYEYIAVNQGKRLPARFIPLILIPHLCEQVMAGSGVGIDEARSIVEGLLHEHRIEHPSEFSLENLMEIKNAIRRLEKEHKRVVAIIAGQRFITRRPQYAVSQTPISARPGISVVAPEGLLADAGATIDSAREHFIEQLRSAGFNPQDACQEIETLFHQQDMQGEQDFTLTRFIVLADQVAGMAAKARKLKGRNPATSRSYESEVSVIEYFSHLKYQHTWRNDHLPHRPLTSHSSPHRKPLSGCSTAPNSKGRWHRPALPEPNCEPDIICDADDEWLIKQQVDNGHLIRMAKDFGMRLVRWCGSNKRVIGVQVGLLSLMAVVYGAQTGGISVVIMLATYLVTNITWLAIDTVSDRIHRIRIGNRIQQAHQIRCSRGELDEPGAEVEDYLDSYSWLTQHGGLANILNSFRNLQNEAHQAGKPADSCDAGSVIRKRRAQCLAQLRFCQLEDSFSCLDNLVVESVQEISRLDQHYCDNFPQLWSDLDQLDSRTLMKVFNEAANSSGLRKLWYLPRQNYTHWVKQVLTCQTTPGDHIALLLEHKLQLDKPLCDQELEVENLSSSIDKHFSRGKQLAEAGASTGLNYIRSTLRSTLWRYIESGITKATTGANPSLAGLAPVPTAASALFWVYFYAATKITETLNNLKNRAGVKEYRDTHTQDRFDIGFGRNKKAQTARHDFDRQLLAIRREAKGNTDEFIKTIKELRREKELIDAELNKQIKMTEPVNMEHLVTRARLILRHKMLEQKVYELMNGAFGNMHNETVKAASWLQDSSGILPP